MKAFAVLWLLVICVANLLSILFLGHITPSAEDQVANEGSSVLSFASGPTLDLNQMFVNSESQFETQLQNLSDAEVGITNISTSCGCTDVEFSSRKIPPLGQVSVKGKIRARSRPGPIHVRVTATAGGQPKSRRTAELVIVADVIAFVELTPSRLTLRPAAGEKGDSAVLNIQNTSEKSVSLTLAGLFSAGVTVSPAEMTIKAGEQSRAVVAASANAEPGHGKVRVQLNDGGETHTVPVAITPEEVVVASPKVLVLGAVSQTSDGLKSTRSAEINLVGKITDSAVQIVSTPELLKFLSVHKTPTGAQIRFDLSESWDGSRPSPIRVSVKLENGVPLELRIPVVATLVTAIRK